MYITIDSAYLICFWWKSVTLGRLQVLGKGKCDHTHQLRDKVQQMELLYSSGDALTLGG